MDFFRYVFLAFDPTILRFVLILMIAAIILKIITIKIKCKLNGITILQFVIVEDFFVSTMIAVVCYNIFCLHYAVIVWILIHSIYARCNKANALIMSIYSASKKKNSPVEKSFINIFDEITKPIHCAKDYSAVAEYVKSKKRIISKSFSEYININFFIYTINLKSFLLGLMIPTIRYFVFGSQYCNILYPGLLTFESWIYLSAILFVTYPILEHITVDNQVHILFGDKKLFDICWSIVSIVLYCVLAAISFS